MSNITMDSQQLTPHAPARSIFGMDDGEELLAETIDEPPDGKPRGHPLFPAYAYPMFGKGQPRTFERRESLLTRQLHSETEHTDEDEAADPPRALSTQSTYSMASTAELTSDDGHSVPSPTVSPPMLPTMVSAGLPNAMKLSSPSEPAVVVVPATERVATTKVNAEPSVSEKVVEANLGRKRCISFACGTNKDTRGSSTQVREPEKKVVLPAAAPAPAPASTESTSPPKRKCALKFACPPTRSETSVKVPTVQRPTTPIRRSTTPTVSAQRSSSTASVILSPTKPHRDSDSTVRHASPTASRKSPAIVTTAATPSPPLSRTIARKFSTDSLDHANAATRFHEFFSSDGEPEEWCQESTAYRSRLTINDTLKKENLIRKACEEVEEEAVLDDEEAEAEIDDDEGDGEDDDGLGEDDDEDDRLDLYEEEDSSDGFRTDDEGGFAASDDDDDGEDSDADWWTPGGLSTAATSVEHMERLFSQLPAGDDDLGVSPSSLGSGASNPPVSTKHHHHPGQRRHSRRGRRSAPIHGPREPDASDLPDSTDFVCGTLDEDRPVEQAFRDHMMQRAAARHGPPRPQDIDPTFPTSDPEMDEDDDDEEENEVVPGSARGDDSDGQEFMHGEMEGSDVEERRARALRRRVSVRGSKSPAPGKLRKGFRSPAPLPMPTRKNTRSPAPLPMPTRKNTRSPPPTSHAHQMSTRSRSPAPTVKIRSTARSPPPPTKAKAAARSPPHTTTTTTKTGAPSRAKSPAPPRKHVGDHSPNRARSPAPRRMITTPPRIPSNDTSATSSVIHLAPAGPTGAYDYYPPTNLAGRPAHFSGAASLPRGGEFVLSRLSSFQTSDDEIEEEDQEDDDDDETSQTPKPNRKAKSPRVRGAIDIVKGLEKKRQRRREKLLQKAAAAKQAAAAKGGEKKAYKVKPGKGAERMREVGLELQRYRGKGEHIISM